MSSKLVLFASQNSRRTLASAFIIISLIMTATIVGITSEFVSALTYQSSVDVSFTFNPTISINLSSSNLKIDDLAPGTAADSNIITIGVTTNAAFGYNLSATVGEKNGTSALTNTGNSDYTFTNLATTAGTATTLNDITADYWGYSYCSDNATNCNDGTSDWVSGSVGSTANGYAGLPLDDNTDASERGKGGITLIATDQAADSTKTIQFKIGASASTAQLAGNYTNVINFYAVANPEPEPQPEPIPCEPGKICYGANTLDVIEGTMGVQNATDGDTVMLMAPNYSRAGYGFAGWSDAYDYSTNPNAHFYGPNEYLTVPTGTTANGLSLYAVWIQSAGTFQNSSDVSQVCNNITQVDYDPTTGAIAADLSSVSALTDGRDNETYAIAKLADGNCWMIENLRLDNTAVLTLANTNNPLNDGTNVTLNHETGSDDWYNTLAAPGDWCSARTAVCISKSRLGTDNTANRATYTNTQVMSGNSNLYGYGNYYNWYSATAGYGIYDKSSGDTVGDICPHGWHLPTGGTSGEAAALMSSMGGITQSMNNSTTPTGEVFIKRFTHFPNNFVSAGGPWGSSIQERGLAGLYWSSTAASNDGANIFGHEIVEGYDTYVVPSVNNAKSAGRTVRCIASD